MPEKEKRVVRLLLQQCTSAQLDLSGIEPASPGPEPDTSDPADPAGLTGPEEVLRRCGQPDDDGIMRVSPTARAGDESGLCVRQCSVYDIRVCVLCSYPGLAVFVLLIFSSFKCLASLITLNCKHFLHLIFPVNY